jgi:Asp-tRNA(Asn)/Glu-tRNA(Gln) amidotransferase A subunit family amidase
MSEAERDYPRLFPKPEQTIAGIGRALREGRITCADVLDCCFDQVDRWEPKVHAWVVLDRDGAIEQARLLDEELKAGNDRGPLHGIPIGIKDLFDVKGLPTACGARRWVARIADDDAEAVARLRTAGAVIMGKTVTTAYACLDPPVTRNPWNLDRTPGGSSSGSAAAVACGMCYGALGTQTGGSITRPASFCGVAGMKPSWFASNSLRQGVLPFAPNLDHVGPIARTLDDLQSLWHAIRDSYERRREERKGPSRSEASLKLVRFRGFFDRRAESSVASMFDEAVRALAAHGAKIVEQDDPVDFEQILKDHSRVIAAEAAVVHSNWLDEFPDDYPPRIRELVLEGRLLSAMEYVKARYFMEETARTITSAIRREESWALITPATVGTAPDTSRTGDPAFNSPWSFTHLPTVSFPIGLAIDALPVSIQIVGVSWHDTEALKEAMACEQIIRSWRQ